MSERLTLATATGLPFVALLFHVLTGVLAFVAGSLAIAVRKGSPLHRRSGLVFVAAMVATGLSAVGIAVYEGNASPGTGALTAYFVITAWTALRPIAGVGRSLDVALMLLAFLFAAAGFANAVDALGQPSRSLDGVPAGMIIFMSTIVLLAALGDVRLLRSGTLQGTRRLTRHLWRMCYGLFLATGSFVAQLVEMTFMPASMRSVPVILVLAAGPLVVLVYWMWRVRLRRDVRGLVTRLAT